MRPVHTDDDAETADPHEWGPCAPGTDEAATDPQPTRSAERPDVDQADEQASSDRADQRERRG